MVTKLGITKKNLQYFLGRFVKNHSSGEVTWNKISKVVLFRKLGCSPATINELLSGNTETYQELLNRSPRKSDMRKVSALEELQKVDLQDISCDLCSELLMKSGLIARTLPYDRFFVGRILDPGNVLIFIGVSASDLLFYHDHGWISLVYSLLWGAFFAIFIIIFNSLVDLRQFRQIARSPKDSIS